MKSNFTNFIAASLILLGAAQVSAANVNGTIQVTRDSSRSINAAYLVTERKDSSGKPIALVLVMDENGKAIAQQYENKMVKIEGKIQGSNITAETWKELKDNSFSDSGSSYRESSSSSREESYEEEEPEEESEEEEEGSSKKKKSSKSSKSKKKSSDDEEDSEEDSEEEESDDSESDSSEESEEDGEKDESESDSDSEDEGGDEE